MNLLRGCGRNALQRREARKRRKPNEPPSPHFFAPAARNKRLTPGRRNRNASGYA
jgi:hypothetical protein